MCYSYRELSNKEVKTRKNYSCEWCAEKIVKGSLAQSRSYVWDGELKSGHMHPECAKAMQGANHDELCDGWMPGDFERPEVGAVQQ